MHGYCTGGKTIYCLITVIQDSHYLEDPSLEDPLSVVNDKFTGGQDRPTLPLALALECTYFPVLFSNTAFTRHVGP